MKIALFHNVPVGGAKRVIFEHAKYLSKKHSVELFLTSTENGMWNLRDVADKIHFFKFELESESNLKRVKRDFRNFFLLNKHHKMIANKINHSGFDLVLVYPDRFTQAPFILKHLDITSVYYCMELLRIAYENELKFVDDVSPIKKFYENATRFYRKQIDKKNAQSATKIVAISKITQRDIKTAYGRNSVVIYPGVDIQVFKPCARKDPNNLFLYVGSKIELEGYNIAKNANEILQKRIINNKIKAIFEVVSFSKESPKLSDKELAIVYSKSLVTICSSLNETFGLSALESMACGTAVLALNEAAYLETMKDGKTGYLLARDPIAFADKIEFLINNPMYATRMGDEGRKHVIKNFTWEKHNNKIEKLLIKLSKNVGNTKLR